MIRFDNRIRAKDAGYLYTGMSISRIREIRHLNEELALSDEQRIANVNVAYDAYARAHAIQRKARNYSNILWQLETENTMHAEQQREKRTNKLKQLEGEWPDRLRRNEQFWDYETTKQRKIEGEQLGIKVLCQVDWGTGLPGSPLLLRNIKLTGDSLPTSQAMHLDNRGWKDMLAYVIWTRQSNYLTGHIE